MGSHVRALGLCADRLPGAVYLSRTTFLGTPMRHRGVHVGSFFLAGKKGEEEFTDEDEEILVMFAAQAATAVANARTHWAEQRARADLAALVETTPVGVVVFDAGTGHIVSLNREANRIVQTLCLPGQSAEQLLFQGVTCRRADGREMSLDPFPLVAEPTGVETVRAEEMVLSLPDGRSVTTLVNATPIQAADGTVASLVVTLQDLTALEELERMRAKFVAMVSHELRAPLTSIKGSAATALSASRVLDPAEVRQFFRIIDDQADHMDSLIGNLLDVGRIEAGTLSVAPEPTHVSALVDQARNTFLSGCARHRLKIDLPPDLPLAMADRERIVQVLSNLLSNAARHAPESSPIRVSATLDGVHVAVAVTDEGTGVAPERLPHLFRKYSRDGRGTGERGVTGGLGLAICKGLLEAHGGRIRAESAGVGRGTQVTFTIPVAEEAATRSPSLPPPAADEPDRILLVDDDPQTLRYVRDALADVGFEPVVTGDPQVLPGIVREQKPRLLLLDLMLPGSDGIELLESLPELADLPVIFISGYGGGETIARALQAGASDYIVKPFSPTELVARIRVALRGRTGTPAPFRLGELAIDYAHRAVTLAGRPVHLTPTEYELLCLLSRNAGRLAAYDLLLRRVWGRNVAEDSELVRTFVKRLRRKLGDDAARPAYIFTERRRRLPHAHAGRPVNATPTLPMLT